MDGYGSELQMAFEMSKIGSKDEFPKWVSLETKISKSSARAAKLFDGLFVPGSFYG